jgi:putative endonuclease
MKNETVSPKIWVVYLLECCDGSLYTGITNQLDKRLETHNAGLGAKYTRGRLPVKLLEFKWVENHSAALKLEAQIKKLPKLKKRAYFQSVG